MSQVVFYIIEAQQATRHNMISDHFAYACSLASFFYLQNKKVFIYTDNQQDAFAIDEYLWQFDGDSFVPHNLLGEGPRFGTPVEISWHAPTHPRSILINLSANAPEFAINFQHIVDFVPVAEPLKINARIRYSAYKKMGLTLSTQSAVNNDAIELTNHTED
ncbi:DNA polymerase III subunit chi [Psychromonas sp. MME2]|uniref:DNA polymerase III subunit chi n=1 Tax=unclassified Psychromonas TaxID=2614957 RepID=UPI00339CC52F